jgi:hypothetical protein
MQEGDADKFSPVPEFQESDVLALIKEKAILEKVCLIRHYFQGECVSRIISVAPESSLSQ